MMSDREESALEGPIKVGDRLTWEKGHWEQIVVTEVIVNSDGEPWIKTEDDAGQSFWNDEERLRESCSRDLIRS